MNECALQISSLSTSSQQSTIFHLILHYSFQFFDCIFVVVVAVTVYVEFVIRFRWDLTFSFYFALFFYSIQCCINRMLFYIYSIFITIIFTLIPIDFHGNGRSITQDNNMVAFCSAFVCVCVLSSCYFSLS